MALITTKNASLACVRSVMSNPDAVGDKTCLAEGHQQPEALGPACASILSTVLSTWH